MGVLNVDRLPRPLNTLPKVQIPGGEAAIFDAFQFRARHERRGEQSYIIAVTRQD